MSATVEVEPGIHVPLKCRAHDAAGLPKNDCTEPGSKLKCQLCPISPNYWRKTESRAADRLTSRLSVPSVSH